MQVALGTPLKQANATGQKRRGRERKRQRPADRSAYLSAHAPPCTHRQAKDSPVPIPNIRRLQARGVSFLNHYVNVVSSTPCFLFSKHRLLSYAHTRTHAHTHSHTLTLSNIRTLCFGCLPAAANLLSVASLNVERQAAAQHSTQPQSVHAFPCFVTPLLRALPLQWRPSARKTCFPQARLLPCRAPLLASSLPSTQRPCLSLSLSTPLLPDNITVGGAWNNYEGVGVNGSGPGVTEADLFHVHLGRSGYDTQLQGKTDWASGGHSLTTM